MSITKANSSDAVAEEEPLMRPQPGSTDAKSPHEPVPIIVEHGVIASLRIIFRYLMAELKKKQRAFKIGFGTIMIVVTFVTALESGLQAVPLAFLKVSENQASEADVAMYPTKTTIYNPPNAAIQDDYSAFSLTMLNHTEISDKLKDVDFIEGSAPRWLFIGKVRNPQNLRANSSVTILFVNSSKELKMGLGRDFPQRLLSKNQAIISRSALRSIGITTNGETKVELYIDILALANAFIGGTMGDSTTSSEGTPGTRKTLGPKSADGMGTSVKSLAKYLLRMAEKSTSGNPKLAKTLKRLETFLDQILPAGGPSFSLSQLDSYGRSLGKENPLILRHNFDIVESVESPSGKWSTALGKAILIDDSYLLTFLVESFSDGIRNYIKRQNPVIKILAELLLLGLEHIKSIKIEEYALMSQIMFKDRASLYLKGLKDRDKLARDRIRYLAANVFGLGYRAKYALPLLKAVDGVDSFIILLEVAFMVVTFFLSLLSILLIYSLMMSNVDEKTYEYSMLRGLGLKGRSVVLMVLMESFIFSIPAIFLSFVVAYLINIITSIIVFHKISMAGSYFLSRVGFAYGLSIGIIMPVVSNILPIQRALSKTLRDGLNLLRRSITDVSVQIVKLENMGVSLPQLVAAISLVVCGFLAYYVVPLALYYQNFGAFSLVMNVIFLAMVFGMILLSTFLIPYVERGVLFVIFLLFWRDRNLRTVAASNLKGHKRRNLKTSLMYSVALAFLIMTGCNLAQQKELFSSITKLLAAADLVAYYPPGLDGGLEEPQLRNYLNELKESRGLIEGYTFVSKEYRDALSIRGKTSLLGPLGGYPLLPVYLYAVEENYLRVVDTEYYYPVGFDDIPIKKLPNGKKDAVDAIYSNVSINNSYSGFDDFNVLVSEESYHGYPKPEVSKFVVKLIIPEGIKRPAAVDLDRKIRFCIDSERYGPCKKSYLGKIRAVLNKFPGFLFSGYEQSQAWAVGVTTMQIFRDLMVDYLKAHPSAWEEYNKTIRDKGFSYGIQKERLLVRMVPGSSQFDTDIVSSGIMNYFKNDLVAMIDTKAINDAVQDNLDILVVFLIIVAIISIVLAFFLLLLSNISNIRENVWEFGILRAAGLNKGQVTRIYLYESFSVILSSMLIGFTIGIVIAVTSDLQTTIFLELPYRLIFPTSLFIVMLGLSLATTFFASYFPAQQLNDIAVADVIRGNVQ